ncbi:MAG: hypothetical protein AB1553_05995 [Nitrospirota bacterium]
MKKKIGTILEEDLIFKAKRIALSQKKSLNSLFEDALVTYFKVLEESGKRKEKNIVRSTRGVMKIQKSTLGKILEEEEFYES